LLLDPKTRDVTDVQHQIVAVGSSSDVQKAKDFIAKIKPDLSGVSYYGNYDDLVKDANVDIIYIATPHSHHYPNALLALEAGKHVCCEKAFTINANQAKHLVKVAREKKRYLMEAVWTRFFPISMEIQRLLHAEKVLGKIHRVFADLSMAFPRDPSHRLYNPATGGGALLDLGIYPLTWAFMTLYDHPENQETAPTITASMMKSTLTPVDEFTTIVLGFPKLQATATLTTSLSVATPRPHCVTVQGEKGDLFVTWAPYRPESFIIKLKDKEPETHEFAIPGQGLFWEADACAREIRDGNIESSRYPLSKSITFMETMDEVRKQGELVYPDALEAVRSDA